jgi:hypothetical protein
MYLDNRIVTDQLSLSIWLDRNGRVNRLGVFEKLLRLFPFSQREQPPSMVSVLAVDLTEPALLERPLNGAADASEIIEILNEYQGEDIAYEYESWWDLWIFDGDWKLAPTRILLSCFGPEFDNGTGEEATRQEDLRIDFGVDAHYLPNLDILGSGKLIESNIKSLLRLVHELDSALPVEKRLLQTESGENFADRLTQVLTSGSQMQ